MRPSGLLLAGNLGCLVLCLMFLNLFFGKIIFGSVLIWLGVELVLFLIFMLQTKFITYQLMRGQKGKQASRPGQVIDVSGQEVEDQE